MSRSVITIGHFDGVHRGHRVLLDRARAAARSQGAAVIAMAFDPHPATVLRPGTEPPRLCSTEEKIARLKEAGADDVVLLKPEAGLLGQTPEQFVQGVVDEYRPVAMVEGRDFRFGKKRAGDIDTLAALGREHGFEVIVQPAVELGLSDMLIAPVSSSLIRWLVGRGRMVDAALCLAEHYSLTGRVTEGEQRGRTIGVPTANLDPSAYAQQLAPADGVYAGYVDLGQASYVAAISIGVKPTFGERRLTVEAHILDFTGDIYGQRITIRFARWLRDQYAFPGIEALRQQLERDIGQTRKLGASGRLDLPRSRYQQATSPATDAQSL